MSICCLWQRTVCTSADKIWRPTRVRFCFRFTSMTCPTVYFIQKILLYADDAVLFYADSNVGNISTVLSKDLKQLQSRTHLNKLCVHPVKTECVLFGTQQRIASATLSDGPFSLFLGDKPINQAQHYIHLGLLIDANLNFKQTWISFWLRFPRESVSSEELETI